MRPLLGLVALAALLTSCQASALLLGIQDDVKTFQALRAPTIQPGTTVLRAAPSSITLSNPGTGTRIFFTTDGSAPLFNQQGIVEGSTSFTSSFPLSLSIPSTTPAAYTVRAVSWYPNKRSDESRADIGVAGAGGAVWAKAGFDSNGGAISAVAVSPAGGLYSGGHASTSGRTVGLLLQTDPSGNVTWRAEVTPNGWGSAKVTGLAADSSLLYVTGNLSANDSYQFGNGNTVGSNSFDQGFLAAYSLSGQCQWVRAISSTGEAVSVNGVAVYSSSAYVVANVLGNSGSLDVGGVTSLAASALKSGSSNGVVLSFDLSGGYQQAFSATSNPGADHFWAIAADASGVYAGGDRVGNVAVQYVLVTVPAGSVSSPASIVLKLNATLTAVSVAYYDQHNSSPGSNTVLGLALAGGGSDLVVAGRMAGSTTVSWVNSTATLSLPIGPSNSQQTGFVAKLVGPGTWQIMVDGPVAGVGTVQVSGVAMDSAGNVFAVGVFGPGTVSISGGYGPYSAGSPRSLFAANLDGTYGAPLWFRSTVSSSSGEYLAVTHDTTDRLLVGGVLNGTATADWGATVKASGSSGGDSPLLLQLFD